MKNSKKTKRILKKIDKIQEVLDFYMNGDDKFNKDFKEIRSLISELALDRKEDHARFAKKLKFIWEKNQES